MSLTPTAAFWRRRTLRSTLVPLAGAALAAGALTAVTAPAALADTSIRTISAAGSATLRSTGLGPDAGVQTPEFPNARQEADAGGSEEPTRSAIAPVKGAEVKSARNVRTSFTGLNFRDQRRANGGNQFSVEPPDQGLCVGNGFVLESTNDVLRVWDTKGNAVTGVVDLNTFYGYPAQINRTTGEQGPFVTDPSCVFDKEVQRWYHVVLTLDQDVQGNLLGSNHLDIAVSKTADPTGAWTLYKIPVQDDGTDGTPNHGCTDGNGKPGPCIGDYPHIGTDANGFYITTNEYELFGPEYKSAQLYAMSKRALAAGASGVKVVQFDTVGAAAGQPGFTLMPASAPAGQNERGANGTEYLLSSDAAEEASGVPVGTTSRRIWLWRLTNTKSLDSANPAPSLSNTALPVGPYSPPPASDQKPGDFPLGQCINDTTTPVPVLGPTVKGCWNLLFGAEPAHTETLSKLDSSDSRMFQVTYADGKVWGSLDTAVNVKGQVRAGIESFVVDPKKNRAKWDYLAVAGNNVTYGAIGVTDKGKAIIGLTLVGSTNHPSAAYAKVEDNGSFGDVQVIAAGAGPQDGFTGYKAIVGDPPRPRWGDYGAAAVDGGTIWLANEYIAQTCTLQTYIDTLGSCGATRTTLGNWATRVSQVVPS